MKFDENAAKNILSEGLRVISAVPADHTGGDLSKTLTHSRHKSEKPEAQHISLAVGR